MVAPDNRADPEVMQKLDLMEEKVMQLVAAKQRAAQLAAEGMHLMPDGSEMLDSEMVSKDDQVEFKLRLGCT